MAIDFTVVRHMRFGQAEKVVVEATATGTATSRPFKLPRPDRDGETWPQVQFQFVVANGTISALVADLEISLDGGTTYSTLATFNFASQEAPIFNANAGHDALYRFNVTTFTGAATPKADIYALV